MTCCLRDKTKHVKNVWQFTRCVASLWNVTARQRHKLLALAPIVLRSCACGHCADCKARQTPEERMAMHLAEVNGATRSDIPSTLNPAECFSLTYRSSAPQSEMMQFATMGRVAKVENRT